MDIDTYFGFFSKSVFTAVASSISSQTGKPVTLEEVTLTGTNTLKLRWSEVETVLIPTLATPVDVDFVFALTSQDTASLIGLAADRTSLQRMMEQAVGAAVEPFNFIAKTRNKLTGLQISRNVTGLTAHHLKGEVNYTMAAARLKGGAGRDFSMRLLVTAEGRDRIEERAMDGHTQRAIFSINEGAYVCRPQWEPPPPPPGAEQGTGLSEPLMNGWIQTFFALNDGAIAPKVFKRPAAQISQLTDAEALLELQGQAGGITIVRLLLNGDTALELIVLLPESAEKSLMSLSKSGQHKFLGDFFRAYFGEAARLWSRFAGEKMEWRLQGVGKIPSDSLKMVTDRLEGGGLVVRQQARMDEGRVEWFLALPPHTWHRLLALTAKAMGAELSDPPEREAIFEATGWGAGALPWPALVDFAEERGLQELVRQFSSAKYGLGEPHLAAVAARLEGEARKRWLAAMPVMLRERTEGYELAEDEPPRREAVLAETLIRIGREGRLPEGKLADWAKLYTEMVWARRQTLIDRLLPLRHFIYGLDRSSLSRLLFDEKGDVLVDLVCGAEFPVVDQMRRAISPGFALRLFEDVAVKRARTSAYAVQEAQLQLYRRGLAGASEGRYMLRATPAKRLGEIVRWLDGPV